MSLHATHLPLIKSLNVDTTKMTNNTWLCMIVCKVGYCVSIFIEWTEDFNYSEHIIISMSRWAQSIQRTSERVFGWRKEKLVLVKVLKLMSYWNTLLLTVIYCFVHSSQLLHSLLFSLFFFFYVRFLYTSSSEKRTMRLWFIIHLIRTFKECENISRYSENVLF